jgi:phosphate acyltransferase
MTIALDAMGGDRAPGIVIAGADMARHRFPGLRYQFYGDGEHLEAMLAGKDGLRACSTVHHADSVVTNDMKPSHALRHARDSSMQLAINAAREGRVDGVVSAGNTGALMAMAKITLKTLNGIDRPAIAGFYPTMRGESVMLDLGANVECGVENLVQFSIMGEVFSRTVLGIPRPTVGLLNVGIEDAKGHDEVKQAAARLRGMDLTMEFLGFVEGDDIGAGTVDVFVTDGFTGNISLKTAEGIVSLYNSLLRQAFRSSIPARIGYLLARNGLAKLRTRIDPRRHNGAMLLGLNGIVIKSHGGTDAFGFANAIGVAVDMVAHGFNDKIIKELEIYGAAPPAAVRAAYS